MKCRSFCSTRAGRNHTENEDSYVADDARCLYALSDGLGNYEGAAVASRLVVGAVSTALTAAPAQQPESLRLQLNQAVRQACARVAAEGRKDSALRNMAATLTLLRVVPGHWQMVQVGDSRGYRFVDGRLEQVTNDHTVAFEQYRAGALRKEQLAGHPNQKLITRTISAARDFVVPDLLTGDLAPGVEFLLCSDGLIKELTDSRIEETLRTQPDPARAVAELVETAARTGTDDITVILVRAGT